MTRPTSPKRHLRFAVTALVVAGALLSMLGLGTVQAGPTFQVQPNSPNGLVINEVFDSQNVTSEYFELYNTSAVAIDLSTYVIYNRDGSTPLSNLDDPIIASGQVRAIGPTQLHTPTIAGSGLARTDFLGLINTSPSDQIIDVVNWGNPPDISWPNYARFAAQFFPAGTIPQLAEDGAKSIQRWPDGFDSEPVDGRNFQQIFRSPGTLSCGDPYEDDNTLATAFPHAVGTYLHRICPGGDADYMAISMSPTVTYTLAAIATNVGSRVDTVLRLYDPSGLEVAVDDPPGSRDSVISFRPTTAGTFRALVTDANNVGAAGPDYLYQFRITAQTPSPTPAVSATPTTAPCVDFAEPDNNSNQAKWLIQNTEQVHTLCVDLVSPDEDWFRLDVSGGKVYNMYTKDLAGPVDTVITLYDASLNFLAENDDYQPGSGLASRIDYTFGSTGTYYLRVREKRGSTGAGYQYTVGLSSTGALPPTGTPTATRTTSPFSPTPTQPPCGDAFEPDGVADTARTILIGSTQLHSVCPATDADWVRFYARSGKVYTIRTGNLGIGLDTYMYLFDSDAATILAQNDDGGEGVSSRIDFYPQRDDWYFVQVKNAGDLGLPDMFYDLSLAVVPGVPQQPGTATAIIAPPVTVTAGPEGRTPTTVVQPTRPPVPTPTQGAVQPTPAAAATTAPITEPTEAPPAEPEPVAEEPTAVVPGVPVTGGKLPEREPQVVAAAPKAPQPAAPVERFAPMLFRIFYDRDSNNRFGRGEGIRGISVYLLDSGANSQTASLVTGGTGDARVTLPVRPQRLYVPYLGISMPLNKFPERELHSLWLPPAILPDRVP
jgi:hypothetical protein